MDKYIFTKVNNDYILKHSYIYYIYKLKFLFFIIALQNEKNINHAI